MTSGLPEFDTLRRMAQHDPEGLERLRRRLIDQVLDAAPEQHRRRLVGLQFRIDQVRARAPNPLASCIKLSAMMHDSLHELRGVLNDPDQFASAREAHTAQIVPIRARTASHS